MHNLEILSELFRIVKILSDDIKSLVQAIVILKWAKEKLRMFWSETTLAANFV